MKKLILTLFIGLIITTCAQAEFIIPVDYTGHGASKAADTGLGPIELGFNFGPLGGASANSFVVERAFQFTLDQVALVDYLSINATAIPNPSVYDQAVQKYIQERLSQGATPSQIGLEINGDATHLPTFLGPSQSISVDFKLIEGSIPYGPDPDFPLPAADVLASSNYIFTTDNSRNNKSFSNLFLPLSAELKTGNTYWIAAFDPDYSGVTLPYTTQFISGIITPEPSTYLLLLFGFMIVFILKRKNCLVGF